MFYFVPLQGQKNKQRNKKVRLPINIRDKFSDKFFVLRHICVYRVVLLFLFQIKKRAIDTIRVTFF